MIYRTFLAVLFATPASASILFATSYNDHTLNVLNLDVKSSQLKVIGKSTECGSEPTWLTLDASRSILYCLNEGWGGASSITSYKANKNGSLNVLDVLPVLKSPVSSTLYGPRKSGLAIAHYDTSTFSTFSIADPSNISLSQNRTYTLASPGPVVERQEAPHLHHTILDPTGKFILSPDLGADLVHVYLVESDSINWKELDPVKALPGSGPRHGVFAVAGTNTFFYTVNELSNSITGYRVTYGSGSNINFVRLFDFSTHGPGGSVPTADTLAKPDQKYILVSSRGENSVTTPEGTSTDPIITFKVDPSTGGLSLVQIASAGGKNPRGFSLNTSGTLVAAALQDDNRIVIIERDVRTGVLGKTVASATVGSGETNGPNYVLFSQ